MKRTSILDIANEVNLSKTTVSWILNGKGKENNISQETIDRVLLTAKKLNYSPNYIAKSLSLGKSNTIGLIVPRITDTFFAQIAETLEKEAGAKGYTVFYGSAEEKQYKEKNLINTFLGKQVDGLIIATSLNNETDIKRLVEMSFPIVLIDRFYPSINTSYVVVKDESGSFTMVSNLLKKGRKRIGLVTISSYLQPIQNRQTGYEHALSEFGIPIDPSLIKEADPDNIETSVSNSVKELLSGNNPIDAIFFATHYLAAVGFKCLKQQNISIPAQVSICCFGDSPYLELLDPPVTAIPMPAQKICQEALRILFNKLENKSVNTEQIILPIDIIDRGSL